MKSKTRQIISHVMGCIGFLALPILFSPDAGKPFEMIHLAFFQRDFFIYVLLLLFFYFNYFILVPKFYFEKKYLGFIAAILFSYTIITFLPLLVFPQHYRPMPPFDGPGGPPPPFRNPLFYIGNHFFQFLIVFIFSLMLKISNRLKQAEEEKIKVELSYLKAQINPHFLFNTLNSIYSLAIDKSDQTPAAVVKLSGMMRYVLSEAEKDFVSLDNEITYMRNYFELQQIRFGNSIQLSFVVSGDVAGKKIAPLILIPFVENAFKHGVNAEENTDIKISIEVKENDLHLEVFNNKVHVKQSAENQSGLGINNTRNRLQLLYPASHKLTIKDTKKDYLVLLTLTLA